MKRSTPAGHQTIPPFGGRLVRTIEEGLLLPPPPSVDLTLDRLAQLVTTNCVATVSGMVRCSGDAANVSVVVELLQGVPLFDPLVSDSARPTVTARCRPGALRSSDSA